MPGQPPNPIVPCAHCLWSIGFGYDRIARLIFGTNQEKHRIYRWKKYHHWQNHIEPFRNYVETRRTLFPPKHRPKLTEQQWHERQQLKFSKKTKRKLRSYLATCINQCLKKNLYPDSVERLVGCTPTQLKAHLESLFQAEMNWNNYGTYWEIDHITAVHHFNIHDPEERKSCYHFSNLQPLTRHQNRRKATKTQPRLLQG